MTPRRQFAVSAFSLAIAGATAAWSQTAPPACDTSLIAASRSLLNGYRARAGYCDGLVSEPHSGGVSLVSLTRGAVTFTGTKLNVRRPVAPDGNLRLRGVDVRAGTSYRLDAAVPANGLSIDLTPAALPAGVTAQSLGLRAWLERPTGTPLYVPVATASAAPASVVARVRFDLGALRAGWTLCEREVCGVQTVRPGPIDEGGVIDIPISLSAAARTLQLRVAAVLPGNESGGAVVDIAVPAK